ncbi:MAG: hypothetical protein HY921_08370 [Elusimicrobia bacterium]|nr:hypothetical protein [Elusimicrobiota bacterium]
MRKSLTSSFVILLACGAGAWAAPKLASPAAAKMPLSGAVALERAVPMAQVGHLPLPLLRTPQADARLPRNRALHPAAILTESLEEVPNTLPPERQAEGGSRIFDLRGETRGSVAAPEIGRAAAPIQNAASAGGSGKSGLGKGGTSGGGGESGGSNGGGGRGSDGNGRSNGGEEGDGSFLGAILGPLRPMAQMPMDGAFNDVSMPLPAPSIPGLPLPELKLAGISIVKKGSEIEIKKGHIHLGNIRLEISGSLSFPKDGLVEQNLSLKGENLNLAQLAALAPGLTKMGLEGKASLDIHLGGDSKSPVMLGTVSAEGERQGDAFKAVIMFGNPPAQGKPASSMLVRLIGEASKLKMEDLAYMTALRSLFAGMSRAFGMASLPIDSSGELSIGRLISDAASANKVSLQWSLGDVLSAMTGTVQLKTDSANMSGETTGDFSGEYTLEEGRLRLSNSFTAGGSMPFNNHVSGSISFKGGKSLDWTITSTPTGRAHGPAAMLR